MRSNDYTTSGFAGELLTVSNTAVGGTSSVYAPVTSGTLNPSGPRAKKALITVETNPIRVRYDGTVPDASTGHLLTAGSSMTIEGSTNITQLSMIRSSGSNATVFITYER